MITACISDYKKSYRKMYTLVSKINDASQDYTRCMILFYSAECGLKSLLLDRWGCLTQKSMDKMYDDQKDLLGSHDLKKLLHNLDQVSSFSFPNNMQTVHGNWVSVEQFHQICRYHIRLKNGDSIKQMKATLVSLNEWISQRI